MPGDAMPRPRPRYIECALRATPTLTITPKNKVLPIVRPTPESSGARDSLLVRGPGVVEFLHSSRSVLIGRRMKIDSQGECRPEPGSWNSPGSHAFQSVHVEVPSHLKFVKNLPPPLWKLQKTPAQSHYGEDG